MAQIDVNHAPGGGFQEGAWYWDPSVSQARQYHAGQFGPGGDAGANWWLKGDTTTGTNNANTAPQSPLEQVNTTIQDSYQKLQDEVVKKFGQYQAGQPFNVDQVLADKTKQAAEQIDPYYKQTLGDYLLGVTRKIQRGANDTQDLLGELSASADSYGQTAKNQLAEATRNATQGFADAGLANSGEALNKTGQMEQATGQNLSDYMRKNTLQAKQITNTNERNIQDTNQAATEFQTNQARQQTTDTSTLAGQLTKEAGQKYTQGFQATLPTELQSASGFDMLKSLGIYS